MSIAEEKTGDQASPTPATGRRLYRSRTDRVIGGIGGGLGEYFGVDPVWFRIGFVVLAIGGGSGILVYLIMWLVVQEHPHGESAASTAGQTLPGLTIVGVVLVIIGTVALVNTIAPDLGRYFWPVIFLGGGLVLIVGGLKNDSTR